MVLKEEQLKKLMNAFKHEDASDDKDLINYFIPIRKLKLLEIEKPYVFLGRYGSGKSATIKKMVDENEKALQNLFLINIYLNSDVFNEELNEVSKTNEYSTFSETLLNLHLILNLIETSLFGVSKLDENKLIQELKALDLNPYGDIISRVFDSITSGLKRIRKFELSNVFGIELENPKEKDINMRRYRELCLKIRPLIENYIESRKILVVIDSMEPTKPLANEAALLTGSLIKHLFSRYKISNGQLFFLMGLPSNLLRIYQNKGGHLPNQDAFIKMAWNEQELQELIEKRIEVVLGETKFDDILKSNFGIEIAETIKYSFKRPRDIVKLVRFCIQAKIENPQESSEIIWKIGLNDYAGSVIGWLTPEWQLENDGFEELLDLLSNIEEDVEKQDLVDKIKKLRKESISLKTLAVNSLIKRLEKWQLISKYDNKFRIHPVIAAYHGTL